MTDYREINALQHDLHRARRLAEFLLLIVGAEWNEWETTFLNSIIRQVDERLASPDKERRKDPLSTRQVEILVELRDDSILYGKAEGFSIPSLIAGCFEMQHLLNERELEFIFNYDAYRSGHAPGSNVRLLPGDIVVVPD